MNDYTFTSEESGFCQRQFVIFFSTEHERYFIKDLGDESGTFVRVDTQMKVSQGNVFTFGKFHIIVNYKVGENPDCTIYIQVYDNYQAKEQM